MSRRPSPNVTPFIPPLSSPNPSLPSQPPSHPTSTATTPAPAAQYLPSTPYYNPYPYLPPAATPAMYPSNMPPAAYPHFSTPVQPPIGPSGLSADYSGYPQFLAPTPVTQPSHLPAPHHPPNATPWGAPPPHLAPTPWSHPAHLPHYPQFGGGVIPPPANAQHSYYPAMTPGMGFASLSPDPWGIGAMPFAPHAPHAPHVRPGWPSHPQPPPASHHGPLSRTTGFTGDRLDPFLPGSCYGPVLSPFLIGLVNANMKINPLITPLPDDGGDKAHLKWNMLYTSNYCQRSDDKSHISWSKGREAPATFPRVTSLRIVTELMSWTIEVVAQNPAVGVTCGEVIDSISDCLYRMASSTDFSILPEQRKRIVAEAYHYNRSVAADVPGGRLKNGMMRLDFLCKHSMFGGIEINNDVVRRMTGVVLPCVFVLRCLKRPVLTEAEARSQRHNRTRSVSRSSDTKRNQSAAAESGPTSSGSSSS